MKATRSWLYVLCSSWQLVSFALWRCSSCLCLSVSPCLCVSLSLTVYVCACVCVFLPLSLSLFLLLSLSLSLKARTCGSLSRDGAAAFDWMREDLLRTREKEVQARREACNYACCHALLHQRALWFFIYSHAASPQVLQARRLKETRHRLSGERIT